MSEYFGPSIQHKQGDTRLFENSSNFRINGGNFIVANDSANVTIQLHDQVQKINEWLKAPDCSTIFNTATNKKTAGTGVWIFKHPKYIEWNNNGGLLWIQGKAGSGKTVMSTTIIDHLYDTSHTVCYHYFDFRDNTGDKCGYRGLLLNMLQQMGVNVQGIHPALQELYSQCNRGYQVGQPSNLQLENTLNRIIQQSSTSGYIVLDALDECSLQERAYVTKWVVNIAEKIQTAVTSRYSPEGQAANVKLIIALDSRNSGIEGDISLYLEDQMQLHFRGELKAKVLNTLMAKAQWQFRWVDCQVRTLIQCGTQSAVIHSLQKLPSDLQETYMKAIQNAKQSVHATDAHCLLMWLTFAFRPLYKKQVADFLAINMTEQELYPSDNMSLKVELIIDSNLVTVDTNSIVQLAHTSVKEFLITNLNSDQTMGLFQINAQLAHASLAKACILYLLKSTDVFTNSTSSISQTYDYAAKYWQAHTKSVQESGPNRDLDDLTTDFLQNRSVPFQTWAKIYHLKYWEEMPNPLYCAALGGLERSVHNLILSGECDINAKGGAYGNALQAAATQGNEVIVQLLLAKGADVNAQGGKYGNALYAAASNGNETIAQLLLAHGADVNAQHGKYGNTLYASVSNQNEAIVNLLLTHGAHVNAQGAAYQDSLYTAVSNRDEAIVQLLLTHGADVDAQGGAHQNALYEAVSNGDSAITQLLLTHGADVNAQGRDYGNALYAAVYNGHEAIVQLLLTHGADVNAREGCCGNALYAAVSSGNESIVQLLLTHGADVNIQEDEDENALYAAVSNGHAAISQLLLTHEADVNAQGGMYGNALCAAVSSGNEVIAQLLLTHGADVNAQGGDFGDALYAAVCNGNEAIVQLLLIYGADVNAQQEAHGNALYAAARNGNEAIVQLLLTNGADVNIQSGGYGNALYAAAYNGDEAIVQLLLTHGADVNAQGGYYGNALQAAAAKGNESIIQLLLAHGADVNALGGAYGHSLYAAACNGNASIVRLLCPHAVEYIGDEAISQLLVINEANGNDQELFDKLFDGNPFQETVFNGKDINLSSLAQARVADFIIGSNFRPADREYHTDFLGRARFRWLDGFNDMFSLDF